jgi:hypothetical protein
VGNPRGWNLDEFMSTLRYERDIRQDLESRRRSEFRKGWGKGSDGEGGHDPSNSEVPNVAQPRLSSGQALWTGK